MPTATKERKKQDLAEKIVRCIQTRERGKKLYARSDLMLQELLVELDIGQEVKLNEHGKTARIIDNFAEGNQFFHGSFARRYQIGVFQFGRRIKD